MSVNVQNTGSAPFDRTVFVRISTPESVNVSRYDRPVFVESATTQTINLSFPVELNVGNYRVTLYYIDGNNNAQLLSGTTDQIGTFSVSQDVTGMEELLTDSSLKVYPTVASDYLMIDSQQEIQKLEVINSSGQSVDFRNAIGKDYQLSVGHLKQGFYILRVTTSDGSFVRKFIRQ